MQKQILTQQKMRAISRLIDENPEIFSGKPEAIQLKEEFGEQLNQVSTLIASLLRPRTTIQRPKQESEIKFIQEINRLIGMGILIATHLNNQSLLHLMKTYKKQLRSISAYKRYEMALHLATELEKHMETAVSMGLTEQMLIDFRSVATQFGNTLEATDNSLFTRKKERASLEKLLKECGVTLRNQFDPFVDYHQLSHPEMYDAYWLLRGRRKRPKSKRNEPSNDRVEISGTVTSALNGLPISNAIINLVGYELVAETDADGYYLFEELPAVNYTVSCHCTGYQLPEPVTFQASTGENLQVNFSLNPA